MSYHSSSVCLLFWAMASFTVMVGATKLFHNLSSCPCFSVKLRMQTSRSRWGRTPVHPTFKSARLHSSISTPSTLGNPNWERITNHQTSKTVKQFKSVHRANKSKRLRLGLTVAEGVRLVTDILSDEDSRKFVRQIVVSEDLVSDISSDDDDNKLQLQHWLRVLHKESTECNDYNERCSINIGTEKVVDACAGTVTTQGVVALMQIPEPFDPKSDSEMAPFYLILDGLADPGNVGTLLRSCAAANVDALILLPDSCDVFNPKAVRSAMGATFRVPVLDLGDSRAAHMNIANFDDLLLLMKHCGVMSNRVFASTMEESGSHRQSIPYYSVDWVGNDKGGAALILGKEGEGLREEVCNSLQQGLISTVHVPMAHGTESLNAAICGSVIMFERMRQLCLLQNDKKYDSTQDES